VTDKLPPIIEAWIKQLSDPKLLAVLELAVEGRVDVKLSSSKGKVSRLPEITFNGGVQEHVAPATVINL
jgi:hypothetical protein